MVHAFLQHAHGHCQIVPITSCTVRNIDRNQSHSEKQFCFAMYIYFLECSRIGVEGNQERGKSINEAFNQT